MNEKVSRITASTGLFIGGILGMAGSFAADNSLRSLAWSIDGMALILATTLLTIFYFRKGWDVIAAGFLIFAIGQSLILSASGIDFAEHTTAFGAGTGLWAVALWVISSQKLFPIIIRAAGVLAGVLFSVVAIQVFTGQPVNALAKPLPFFAYPIFVITIFGWAWTLLRNRVEVKH